MSEELKDFTVTPTLTFEPLKEEAPVAEVKKEEPTEPKMDDSILSPEERKMVDDFAKQIDIRNSTAILQYGAGTQKKMADFSEDALVLVMEHSQREKILEKYGHADPENVYVLTELVGDELEIIDPYGGTLQAYGLCYETMRKTILKLVNLLNESEDNGTD